MNTIVDSIFNMNLDVYLQEDYQDPNTSPSFYRRNLLLKMSNPLLN
jgi:hypothetical protein